MLVVQRRGWSENGGMAQAGVGAEMSNVVGWMDAQAGNGSALLHTSAPVASRIECGLLCGVCQVDSSCIRKMRGKERAKKTFSVGGQSARTRLLYLWTGCTHTHTTHKAKGLDVCVHCAEARNDAAYGSAAYNLDLW